MSTAQDLPVPLRDAAAPPALRLVPTEPLDFDEAVRSVRPRLHRYAIRRLGDVHEAEELVQEALLRAYSHRHQLLTEDDLGAWATVVTGRLVIDRLRVRGRSTSVADVPESARVGRDTADVVVARDEARVALDALDAMPSRQAALLWAREVEGQTYEELCVRFSMTEPAVRSVLTRARKALRKEYALRGGTLPAGGLAVLAPWFAGLTWAEKLRRAATRVVTPAALGTAGIATLGGLMFTPFGIAPGEKAPALTPFAPAQSVVVAHDTAPRTTSPLAQLGAAPTSTETGESSALAGVQQQAESIPNACLNDQDSEHDGVFVDRLALPKDLSAGSKWCDKNEVQPRNRLELTPTLPDNPTGVTRVGVSSDKIDCAAVHTAAAVTCSPEPSNAGAQR